MTERQTEELLWSRWTMDVVEDNRIGAGLARLGLARRDSEYVPKTWGDGLSEGYREITYTLTAEGIAEREVAALRRGSTHD